MVVRMKTYSTIPRDSSGHLYSERYGDLYSSRDGALPEGRHVFLDGNRIEERFAAGGSINIAELGFGTGTNFFLTLEAWKKGRGSFLNYVALDELLLSPEELCPGLELLKGRYPYPEGGFYPILFPEYRVRLVLLIGDVEELLPQLEGSIDAWYLDGFAPRKNPKMWSDNVMAEMARLSRADTTLATYSSSSSVRAGLQAAGFETEKAPGFGRKREMLRGKYIAGSKHSAPKSVAIIGAGLAGAAVAHALQLRGITPCVFDKEDGPAKGASGNPRAIIMPHISLQPEARSEFSQKGAFLSKQLLEHAGLWEASGVIRLTSSKRLKHVVREHEPLQGEALFRRLQAFELSEVAGVPLESDGLFFNENAGYASPKDFVHYLLHDTEQRLLSAIDDLSELAEFDAVVIANGFEAKDFSPWLPLEPVRGQLCEIASDKKLEKLRCVLCYDGYVTPQYEGRHLLGATYNHFSVSREVIEADNEELLRRLQARIRLEGPATILSSRAGVRTSVLDKTPVVGRAITKEKFQIAFDAGAQSFGALPPTVFDERLYYTVGHASHGMSSCVLSGELLVSKMLGEPLPVAKPLLGALCASRFLLRAMRKHGCLETLLEESESPVKSKHF